MDFLRRIFSKRTEKLPEKKKSNRTVPENWNKPFGNWEQIQKIQPHSTTIGEPHRMDSSTLGRTSIRGIYQDYHLNFHLFSPSGRYILEMIHRKRHKEQNLTLCVNDGGGFGPLLEIIDFSNKKVQLFAHEKLVGTNPCELYTIQFAEAQTYTLCVKDDGGLGPLLEIIDCSNKKVQLFANEKLVGTDPCELYTIQYATRFHSVYWISDAQLVIIYTRASIGQLVQCLYTINYETNTYKEEVFGYMRAPQHLSNRPKPPNPLLINNKAYFTMLDSHYLHLIPWTPSNECKHISMIVLNRKDPLLLNGNYRLVVGQESIWSEAFYFNYGSKIYFYINNRTRDYEYAELSSEQHFEIGVGAIPDRMVYIDFSKYNNIDLTKDDLSFSFELAYFTRNEDIEDGISPISDDNSDDDYSFSDEYSFDEEQSDKVPSTLPSWMHLEPRFHNFNGRYITYTMDPHLDGGFIFDLKTMTWAHIPETWIEDTWEDTVEGRHIEKLFFNGNTIFHVPKGQNSGLGYNFRCAEILLGQPRFKSLAERCRQKLIYSEEVINVPPHMFKIIFPSP